MEKELNIAAILKDKSEDTKLWSPIVGECTYSGISSKNGAIIATFTDKYGEERDWDFKEDGRTLSASDDADVCLFPSKSMRSWEKFAWKKGDVLVNGCGFMCIFKEWATADYTKFNGCYSNNRDGYEDVSNAETLNFNKVDHNKAYGYIREIEKKLGGIFNTSTLEIVKPQFKDGDIIKHGKNIYIVQNFTDFYVHVYAGLIGNTDEVITRRLGISSNFGCSNLATDSEKQQLFDALAKEGKAWDADKKAIVDLPKKCEFKPFDKVLVRDSKDEYWRPAFFASLDELQEPGWISVEDELPPYKEDVIVCNNIKPKKVWMAYRSKRNFFKKDDNDFVLHGDYEPSITHWRKIDKLAMLNRNHPHQVDPSTVCQYTGLKDKSLTPIYEGDIIQNPEWPFEKRTVTWVNHQACYMPMDEEGCQDGDFSFLVLFKEWTVVGNKFDRKEEK